MHRLAIATLLLLFPLAVVADEPAEVAAAPIEVVRTWDDLEKRPAIELDEGPAVRVGIESHSISRQGGVLLYVLVDGDEWRRGAASRRNVVGPLRMEIEVEHEREKKQILEQIARQVRNAEWAGAERLLFVATVPYEPGGAMTVTLLHGEKTVVARTKLQPLVDDPHPWFAFQNAEADRQRLHNANEMIAELSPDLTRAAVPEFDGDRPYDWVRANEDVDPDRQLPRLIPTQGPALAVTVRRVREQHELIVKFPDQIMTASIGSNLIARWWVDGEPVVEARAVEQLEQMAQARRFVRSNTLRIRLDVPDGSFGNFGGERVQVELMYCPDGVVDSGELERMQQLEQMFVHGQKQRRRVPIRSNRVEFQMPHKFASR